MQPGSNGRWWVVGALSLILAVAAVLRVWGMDYGIPHPTARPDEERIVGRAYHMLATGNLHPGSFDYPSLLMYLNTAALGVYFAVGKLLGHYDRLFDFLFDVAVLRPGLHYRVARMVSVLFGVATVAVTYRLGREGYRHRAVGLLAAAALAACYLHVRDSRFATVDIVMTFFVTASLLFAVRAAEEPSYRNLMLAGINAGLAASTKYNAGAVVLAIVAAVAIARRRFGEPVLFGALTRLSVTGLAFGIAFAMTSPYVLWQYPAALADMERVSQTIYRPEGSLAVWTHFDVTFPAGLGWSFFLAAMTGVLRALWRRRATDRVLLAFALPFFALIASVNVVYPRYVLPLIPILAVLAAELLVSLVTLASRARLPAYAVATLVLAGPGLLASIRFDRLASRSDTRILTAEWVAEHVAPQSEILLCRGYGAPAINADRRRPPAFRPEPIGCTVDEIESAEGDLLVTHEHPRLQAFSHVPASVATWLEEHARLVAVFDPFAAEATGEAYFYSSDAFYLPFTGLEGTARGGPLLRVWRLLREDANRVN